MSARTILKSKGTLLDLYCGAGGAAVGYHRAGFDIVGVDINPQPNYPFRFIQSDALKFVKMLGGSVVEEFDAVHASPPCQAYSMSSTHTGRPRLIEPTHAALRQLGLPYVIENVKGAPLYGRLVNLCGTMFDLNVWRHRWFLSNVIIPPLRCDHTKAHDRIYYGREDGGAIMQSFGKPVWKGSVAEAPHDMGIDWMKTWEELTEAIPPAYTEYVGKFLCN